MTMFARLLLVLIAAIVIGGAGYFATGFGFYEIAILSGARDMNGGLAIGAFLQVAPIGGAIAALVGAVVAWRMTRNLSRHWALLSVVAITAVALLAGGGAAAVWWWEDQRYYDVTEGIPEAHIEVRLPERMDHAAVDRVWRKGLITPLDNDLVHWDEPRARDDGGVTILRATARIFQRTRGRRLELFRAGAEQSMLFELDLPRAPDPDDAPGAWTPVTGVLDRLTGEVSEGASPELDGYAARVTRIEIIHP